MKQLLTFILILALAVLTACGGGHSSSTTPTPVQPQVTISVSPSTTVTLAAKTTQQYTATVTGSTNTAVTWQVNGITGGNEAVGTIDVNGLFMAPSSPPDGGVATIRAISQADIRKTASANATIVFGNASFVGPYVATLNGSDMTGTFYALASFGASGTGNVINGSLDFHKQGNLGEVITTVAFNGSYGVDSDGRGTLTMMTDTPTINESVGPHIFSLTLTNSDTARLISADPYMSGQATINRQTLVSFVPGTLSGGWVFRIGNRLGRLDVTSSGQIVNGYEDFSGTTFTGTQFTGTLTANADGTGTVSINDGHTPANFVLRGMSSDRLIVMSSTAGSMHSGFVQRQQPGLYGNASLKGDFAMFDNGSLFVPANGAYSAVGHFTSNGAGLLTSGMLDVYSTNTPLQSIPFGATYDFTAPPVANGRGTAAIVAGSDTLNMVFYMTSPTNGVFLDALPTQTGGGQFFAQTGGPFTAAPLKGSYALYFWSNSSTGMSMYCGHVTLDGASHLVGTGDLFDSGTIVSDVPFTGTYSVLGDGRGTANITVNGVSMPLNFVAISPTQIRIVGTDGVGIVGGIADKRF